MVALAQRDAQGGDPSTFRQEQDLFCPQDSLPKGQKSSDLPECQWQLPLGHRCGSAGARGEPPCLAYTATPLPVAPINCMAKPLQNSIKIILPHLKDCQVASLPVLIYFFQNLALLTFSAPTGRD